MLDAKGRVRWQELKRAGWLRASAIWSTAFLLYLTLTGLLIFLLPFQAFSQHAVLLHTAIGVLLLVPFLVYLTRHILLYWSYPLNQTKFTGWCTGLMALVCCLSGVVLTAEGIFSASTTDAWRTVHIVTTFGLVFFLVPHLGVIVLRERRKRDEPAARELVHAAYRHLRRASLGLAVGMLLTVGSSLWWPGAQFVNEFPADYEMDPYGNGPFAPSLARTASGDAMDSRSLSGSASCGTVGCHEQIYREWLPSAHRYAAMDAGFQAIQGVMAQQNGPVSTRYCAGCHDPISLFSGAKFVGVEDLTGLEGYHEGISCRSCHAIQETDIKGNANFVMGQPEPYLFEGSTSPLSRFLGDFLIRAYPRHHVATLSRRMFKTPEFCAACHKQFIDKDVNKVGWVQLQNQFDNWKASRWNHPGDPARTLECRECHMPLVASTDPAAGDVADYNRTEDDRLHRSHRFLGANQFIPKLHELEGAEEHCELTEAWLRGEVEVAEIADRWNDGPAMPLLLDAPRQAVAGQTIALRVRVVNNKAGHDFPTGPLDIIQAWVEVKVEDEKGAVVFHSGAMDDENFIGTGTFMFKAEPVDRYGNLIDRHNLWEMVGVRFKRSLFPGAEETTTYDFVCSGAGPEESGSPAREERLSLQVPQASSRNLLVTAELKYRKFDQYLLNYAFGEDSGLTAPVTTLSHARASIEVVPASGE